MKGDVFPVGKDLAPENWKTKSERTEKFEDNIGISQNSLFAINKENPTRCNSVSKIFNSYLYEAQDVSGDTHRPPLGA
jgi:hypothetical protein